MNIIVNVSENWGIGKDNELLVRIPEDMKFFRSMTLGKAVIMGRKTLESFPDGQPLKNRMNIVITKDRNYQKNGAIIVNSIDEALKVVEDKDNSEVFIIGGASIYSQMLKYADTAYVTKVSASPEADVYFPNLDELSDWKLTESSSEAEYEGVKYRFCTYKKQS